MTTPPARGSFTPGPALAPSPNRKEHIMTVPRILHPAVTEDLVIAACERRFTSLDDPGFCTECGAEAHGIEPDAEGYRCEACGALAVCGCEALLFDFL